MFVHNIIGQKCPYSLFHYVCVCVCVLFLFYFWYSLNTVYGHSVCRREHIFVGSWAYVYSKHVYVYSKYYIECLSWTELSVYIPFGKGSNDQQHTEGGYKPGYSLDTSSLSQQEENRRD